MGLVTYINFRKETEEVLGYYEKVLDGTEIEILTFEQGMGDYPKPEEDKKLVMNATIKLFGTYVMMSDTPDSMGESFVAGNNYTLAIILNDKEKLTSYFNALKQDGKEVMPLQATSWSECYGMLTDKFGITWQFNLSNDKRYL